MIFQHLSHGYKVCYVTVAHILYVSRAQIAQEPDYFIKLLLQLGGLSKRAKDIPSQKEDRVLRIAETRIQWVGKGGCPTHAPSSYKTKIFLYSYFG